MELGPDASKEPEVFLKGKKILLVEDNEINRKIAQEILGAAGLVIDTVDDGTKVVDTIKNVELGAYDLILMDIQMPIMDGFEATRQIQAMEDSVRSSISIVAMLENTFDEDRQMAMEARMKGHVAKPIDISKLIDTLKEILMG